MGTMYKEIIYRRKLPVLLFLFGAMLVFILLSDFINNLIVSMRVFCNIFFLFLMINCCIYEVYKCRIKYKYSIIADQLIIHKINGTMETLVEDIKIKDIQYIGKSFRGSKRLGILSPTKYICSVMSLNKYYCSYRYRGKINKFYFEPSEELINKVKIIKEKSLNAYDDSLEKDLVKVNA